jgi:hypothetical protein
MINIYKNPKDVETNQNQWWFVYDETNKNIVVEPQRCSGSTSGPYTMVVADTKEELNQYILDNDLILSSNEFDFTYNIE